MFTEFVWRLEWRLLFINWLKIEYWITFKWKYKIAGNFVLMLDLKSSNIHKPILIHTGWRIIKIQSIILYFCVNILTNMFLQTLEYLNVILVVFQTSYCFIIRNPQARRAIPCAIWKICNKIPKFVLKFLQIVE